ncbi:Hypothetical predicted protein, partial [Mytilus galloprovincialis]
CLKFQVAKFVIPSEENIQSIGRMKECPVREILEEISETSGNRRTGLQKECGHDRDKLMNNINQGK